MSGRCSHTASDSEFKFNRENSLFLSLQTGRTRWIPMANPLRTTTCYEPVTNQAKEQEEIYQLISQRCRQVNTRQDVQNFLKNLDQPNAINVSTINALKPKAYASPALGLVVDGQSMLSNVSVGLFTCDLLVCNPLLRPTSLRFTSLRFTLRSTSAIGSVWHRDFLPI